MTKLATGILTAVNRGSHRLFHTRVPRDTNTFLSDSNKTNDAVIELLEGLINNATRGGSTYARDLREIMAHAKRTRQGINEAKNSLRPISEIKRNAPNQIQPE